MALEIGTRSKARQASAPSQPSSDVLQDPLVQPSQEQQQAQPLALDLIGQKGEQGKPKGRLARFGKGLKSLGKGIGGGLKSAGKGIGKALKATGKGITKGASALGGAALSGAKAVGDLAVKGANKAGRGLKAVGNTLSEGWDAAKNKASGIGDTIKTSAKGGATNGAMLAGAVPGLIGAGIGGGLGALGGKKAATTGAKIGGGLLGGLPALAGGALGGLWGAIQGGVEHMLTDEEKILQATADIPAFHVIVEQLAHTYAYGRGDASTLAAWGYEISAEYEDTNSGFRVVGFVPSSPDAKDPDGNPLKPVVAFRGTANAGGALDDANGRGIGTFQFSRNARDIKQVLSQTKGPGVPLVTGHSLGGALAQLAAARFGSMVGNVVTFQAPGIHKQEADKIDPDKHKSTHYRAAGDLVSDAGEAHSAGEIIKFGHQGPNTPMSHLSFPLAELNQLRAKHDLDTPPAVEGARSNDDHWSKGEEKQDVHQVVHTGKARNKQNEEEEAALKQADAHLKGGQWDHDDVQTKSRLYSVERSKNNKQAGTTMLTTIGGLGFGRKLAEGTRSLAGKFAAKRQTRYAKAWDDIQERAKGLKNPDSPTKIHKHAAQILTKHKVDPKDHGKFISQAEAYALEVLEKKAGGKAKPAIEDAG